MSLKHFYSDPYLHIRSFAYNLCIALAACAVAYALHSAEFYYFAPHWWHLALVPLGIYVGGLSAVFIHNASHGSFPYAWMDRLFGQIAGMHQLWGFFGWKFIHMLHHQYSDRDGLDPHPPKGKTFWQFTRDMFLKSSFQVTKRYREHWGMSRRTQLLRMGVYMSFLSMVAAHLVFWYLLLGPVGFVFFFVPSYVANHLLFADINYRAHPADPDTGDTRPANMNDDLYYKIANALWFGIYFHGNHHRRPTLFNPRHMEAQEQRLRAMAAVPAVPMPVAASVPAAEPVQVSA